MPEGCTAAPFTEPRLTVLLLHHSFWSRLEPSALLPLPKMHGRPGLRATRVSSVPTEVYRLALLLLFTVEQAGPELVRVSPPAAMSAG